jgi:hypothetical protein
MAWYNFLTAPKSLVAKNITDFTAPKSVGNRIRSFQYEGHGGINKAIQPTQYGTQASVYAPHDLASIGVLSDARNRVGF